MEAVNVTVAMASDRGFDRRDGFVCGDLVLVWRRLGGRGVCISVCFACNLAGHGDVPCHESYQGCKIPNFFIPSRISSVFADRVADFAVFPDSDAWFGTVECDYFAFVAPDACALLFIARFSAFFSADSQVSCFLSI